MQNVFIPWEKKKKKIIFFFYSYYISLLFDRFFWQSDLCDLFAFDLIRYLFSFPSSEYSGIWNYFQTLT